jgi:large subunit ribosomal protein L10
MAKTKKDKEKLIEQYIKRLKEAKAIFVITPTGITPNEANQLRSKLLNNDSTLSTVKNSLFKIALDKTKTDLEDIDLSGENAVIFCQGEISESAKFVYNFLDEIKKGKIKGGFLDSSFLSEKEIETLAKLPPKEILLVQTVNAFQAPISSFVRLLNANTLNLINVLNNISEK